jgi:hypothetical protein
VFTLAIFANAALIFALQPMFARMVTPLMGGSPAVWNTSMVFFQGALLLGYFYAHGLQRVRDLRVQGAIHAAFLLFGLALQPIAVSGALGPPDPSHPIAWTLGVLALSVGAPFIAASATAPLLQAWYARSGRSDASDPYYLYAASNLGSLIGLLGYPVLVEPLLGAAAQSEAWRFGYALAAVLITSCAALVIVAQAREVAGGATASPPDAITWRDRLLWLLAAAAPSSLLLGVTQHISTDVASAPFLWVAPLALYLITFIIAFARGGEKAAPLALILHPLTLALLMVGYFAHRAWGWALLANLACFFLSALVCHLWLAARRPPASRVTEFFLWISAGGVVGGAATALAAPVIFNGVYEYPLALAACALFRPRRDATMPSFADVLAVAAFVMLGVMLALGVRQPTELAITAGGIGAAAAIVAGAWPAAREGVYTPHRIGFLACSVALAALMTYVAITPSALVLDQDGPAAPLLATPLRWLLLALSFLTFAFVTHASLQAEDRVTRVALGVAFPLVLITLILCLTDNGYSQEMLFLLALGAAALAIFLNRDRPFILAALVLVGFGGVFVDDANGAQILRQTRSFFGVARIEQLPSRSQDSNLRIMMHGTTIHGAQLTGPDVSRRPITYYNPQTALGEAILAGLAASDQGRLALVGLGAGSTACLMSSRDELTIFEIDPEVVRLSTGAGALFTYVPQCAPEARVVIGDARLSLANEPDGRFDVIVLDAFSSDAVPAHLLTREAIALYLDKLTPRGVLVMHLSNRNLALVAEAARVVRDLNAGWAWRVSRSVDDPLAYGYGGLPASVMVAARDQAVIDDLPLLQDGWRRFPAPPGRAWSDDYINLPRALYDSLTGREDCYTNPDAPLCRRDGAAVPPAP